jgi:hypothetical protein
MAAGRAGTFWLLLAAPGVVVIALAALDRVHRDAPAEPHADAPPLAPAIAAPPGTPPTPDESGSVRADDSACLAAGHDDGDPAETFFGHAWRTGPDGTSRVGAPDVHFTGRLIDAKGSPVHGVRLRFWSPSARKNAYLEATGVFDLAAETDDVTYDVDAILFEDGSTGTGVRRLHVGRVRPGDHDVVLRLRLAQDVLAAGTLLEDDGHPLAGWTLFGDALGAARYSNCVARATTDATGRFRLVGWKKQPLTFRAESPNGMSRTIVRQDVDADTGEIRVRVAPPGIAGRVIVEIGGSPGGAVVRLRCDTDGAAQTFVVGESGVFYFGGIDLNASYELSVEFKGSLSVPCYRCAGTEQDARVYPIAPEQYLAGRALDATGASLANTWLRFVAVGGATGVQTMTDADGAFATTDARGVDYDAFVLVPGPDGRLVPGPKLGRCRGGDRNLQLRAPR